MKFFLDTADCAVIKQWAETGLIDGVTTNPTHLSKVGGNPTAVVKEICQLLPEGEVSVEITEKDPVQVYKQARAIAALSSKVVVKIPCHKDYYGVINKLAQEEIPLNITLVFSALQGLMMCKLGVAYVSPFLGRLDDIDSDALAMITDLKEMRDAYDFDTEILAASVRTVRQVHEVATLGVDVVTMPPALLETMVQHPLTNQGIALFDAAWAKLGIQQFP